MEKIKHFIRKYFKSLTYFYRYLRYKIFVALALSIAVSFLDSLGLSMFFPLLQIVGGEGKVDEEGLGKIGYLVEGIQGMGIHLTLVTVLGVMLVFFIFKGIASYLNAVYIIILQQRFIRKIRLNLLSGLNAMSFKRFITSDVGRIQNTMSGEVDRVSRAFTAYFKTFQQAAMVTVYMALAFVLDVQFAILVTLGGGLTNFLYKAIYKRTKAASWKLTTYNSIFQGQILQHIRHFKYLRTTGKVKDYAEKLRDTIFKIEKSRRKIGILGSVSNAAREPLMVGVVAVVIIVQIKVLGGAMGSIMVSLLFFYRALFSLTIAQQQWNTFMEVSGSLENLQDFQEELKNYPMKQGEKKLDHFQSSITLQNVSFSYGSTPILKNINFTIQKNTSVAFVGESGSGKTTLVNLITGLMPVNDGRILIDKTPIKELNNTEYQQKIGFVSQDPVIFNDTIYNNVTFWAPATPQNIQHFQQCIQQASLATFLRKLPHGRKTQLGNNGINLSGGQKQRISIARELFKEIDILILDEATSALDSETEKEIQHNIDALQGKYTILMIAHRLSTIRNADVIVFMDKGEILGIDSFEGLLKTQKRFKKMVELQEL